MAYDLTEFRGRVFMPSRIPAQDALEAFVPTGETRDAERTSARQTSIR